MALGAFLAFGAAQESGAQTYRLDARSLPLGDGRVSSAPRPGYVYSCMTRFRGGGAFHAGDWIHGATWDSTAKIRVQGEVAWPDARFSVTAQNGERRIAGNGLPLGHTTGIYPVQRSDPAFQIDRNPNRIEARQIVFSLPLVPRVAPAPSCVPMGVIGVALDGVALFNALDAAGRDAVAHEVQDRCDGHPERSGTYHYHGPSPCVPGTTQRNTLVGYALDGFGITSMYDEDGRELTNADLDECHGRVSRISWNGGEVSMYHYVMTREYPYTVGCYRGAPLRLAHAGSEPRPGNGPAGGPPRPPAEAISACAGLSSGAPCRFISPRGDAVAGTCRSPAGELACVPERSGKM
jgi:YHYH protein